MFDTNTGFDLTSLNLSGVKAATVSDVLKPGRYVCEIRSCKLEDTKAKDGSKLLAVLLAEENGRGVITARINVHNVKSAEATRIGREQLRALAQFSGANPDSPFATGMNALNGFKVGVVVGSEKYQGEDRSRVTGFMPPEDVVKTGGAPAPAAAPAGSIGVGDIPF